MSTKSEIAVAKFLQGYNCAQSVIYAFSDDLGIDKNTALKIACGFGAGMGRKQEVCGAVTGGIMVIGLKYGRGENETRKATELTYAKTREMIDRFSLKHETIICRKLIGGCDLATEEGQRQFRENELLKNKCKWFVKSVVEIIEEIA